MARPPRRSCPTLLCSTRCWRRRRRPAAGHRGLDTNDTTWLSPSTRRSDAGLRLICFPYVGAGPAAFRVIADALAPAVDVLTVQMPGRGPRLREPPLTSIAAMAGAIVSGIADEITGPYAIFGYSMGSIVAFEAARLIARERLVPPHHLFVAAHPAPHAEWVERPPRFEDDDVLEYLGLFASQSPIFDDPEMRRLMIPIVRADLRAITFYRYRSGAPLDVPITAVAGDHDPLVNANGLEQWSEQTTNLFRQVLVPGEHFFLHQDPEALLEVLLQDLAPLVGRPG